MADTRLIVGLGNPGSEYHNTRHNVGFMAIDTISKKHHIPIRTNRNQAHIGEGQINGHKVILAKPMTYMNLSGAAVKGLMRRFQIAPSELLVIYDDAALPLGRLRIRPGGSAGGHNGIKSIINSIGTQDFPRIRIGIGSTDRDLIDHVLSKFQHSELMVIYNAIDKAIEAVEVILDQGLEAAMNRFNAASIA